MINNQNDPQETDFKKLPHFEVSDAARAALIKDHQDHYVRPYKTRLEKLITICREHNILPVLVTQPVLYGGGVDAATGVDLDHRFVAKDMDGATAWQVLELYNDMTREVGREQGVLVIDLARQMPKNSTYYFDLMHYTNAGAAQVADIVAAPADAVFGPEVPGVLSGGATPPASAALVLLSPWLLAGCPAPDVMELQASAGAGYKPATRGKISPDSELP